MEKNYHWKLIHWPLCQSICQNLFCTTKFFACPFVPLKDALDGADRQLQMVPWLCHSMPRDHRIHQNPYVFPMILFEHTCAYARWAHVHHFLSVRLSVTSPKFRLENNLSLHLNPCKPGSLSVIYNIKLLIFSNLLINLESMFAGGLTSISSFESYRPHRPWQRLYTWFIYMCVVLVGKIGCSRTILVSCKSFNKQTTKNMINTMIFIIVTY